MDSIDQHRDIANEKNPKAQRVVDAISECQRRGEFTDVTIICNGTKFEVHKVIVCSQSSVFHAACTGNFKEASSGIYDMGEGSTQIVETMLDFLYTGDYAESFDEIEAEKNAIHGLCRLAARKFKKSLDNKCGPLEFLGSIHDVYAGPPASTLKAVATRFARYNLASVLKDESTRKCYDEVVAEVPHFAKDVLDSYMAAPLLGRCYRCGSRKPTLAFEFCCRCGIRAWGH